MIKFLEKIKTNIWFWYILLFILGGLFYSFQASKYSSIFAVKFSDVCILMLGVIFFLFIIQAIGISLYNTIFKENDSQTINIDMNTITPFFVIISMLFLLIFFFPYELKIQVLEKNLDKINTISNQDYVDMKSDIDAIQELSNLEDIFPESDDYESE